MTIHLEFGERNSVVEFSLENHCTLKEYAMMQDIKHGCPIIKRNCSANSYDCDDYLFVVWLVNRIVESYNQMNYNPYINQWREGYKEVPYIHVELYEGNSIELVDGIPTPNDKGLDVHVTGPFSDGYYVLWLDRNYLLRYISFLQQIFDKNQELVFKLPSEVCYGNGESGNIEDVLNSFQNSTKEELLLQAHQLISQGLIAPGDALLNYANTLPKGAFVQSPSITFINGEFRGLIFPDKNRKALAIPLKKTIFNTSGFAKFFERRNELITSIFIESFLSIVAHEFSHVVNGHCLLGSTDPDYANQKHIRICAEQNADDTAIRLRLTEPVFCGIDGNPHNYRLAYSAHELIETWAIRSFSMHLGLSWMYRGSDRVWAPETLEKYLKDRSIKHPLYQFRTYNSIHRMINHLSGIPNLVNPNKLVTADGQDVDDLIVSDAIHQALDMINSFESCFEISYGEDERSLDDMLQESWKVEKCSVPDNINKTPYLLPAFDRASADEIKRIYDTWSELKERLEENGTYSLLYKSI